MPVITDQKRPPPSERRADSADPVVAHCQAPRQRRQRLLALKRIRLDIAAGELVAIMGPSSSGKGTAMNILGCLNTPSAGMIGTVIATAASYMLSGVMAIPYAFDLSVNLLALGACRTWGVEAKFGPSEDSFRRICRPIAVAMGQKAGKKWTAAAKLQPTFPKSDRLLVFPAFIGVVFGYFPARRAARMGPIEALRQE